MWTILIATFRNHLTHIGLLSLLKYDHITLLLRDLHRLCVWMDTLIQFKLCVLVFRCLHWCHGPTYVRQGRRTYVGPYQGMSCTVEGDCALSSFNGQWSHLLCRWSSPLNALSSTVILRRRVEDASFHQFIYLFWFQLHLLHLFLFCIFYLWHYIH